MSTHASRTSSAIVPTIRYRDVPAAIAWLTKTFGFKQHRVLDDEEGRVRYAELTFGRGMVMIGPVEEGALGKLMIQPGDIGGVETQICYLFVDDAQAHYERARAVGADIVLDIRDEANGGRGYSCRDPEGHIWNFGTYDPWMHRAASAGDNRRAGRKRRSPLVLTVLCLLAGAAYFHTPTRQLGADVLVRIAAAADHKHPPGGEALRQTEWLLTKERLARSASEETVKQLREQLALELRLREAAEQAAAHSGDQINLLREQIEKTGSTTSEVRAQLERAKAAKNAAERTAKEARDQLAAREATEKAKRAQVLALRERRRSITAERQVAKAKAEAAAFPRPFP